MATGPPTIQGGLRMNGVRDDVTLVQERIDDDDNI